MASNSAISKEDFLRRKRDYSDLLVHLTRDTENGTAKQNLESILQQHTIRAYDHHCFFSSHLRAAGQTEFAQFFRVACFTETPIDLIGLLTLELAGRQKAYKPFGLVFKKDYVAINGGNPVFYAKPRYATRFWSLFDEAKGSGTEDKKEICSLLALVNSLAEHNDWHWEREWRTVGDFHFDTQNAYCGLCPQSHIRYFELAYGLPFIDPGWTIGQILDRLVLNHRAAAG